MDTRSADPDLQLDVDVMILEYTLFHAVEARFQVASTGLQEHDDNVKEQEALRLLHIFDSFIRIFNQQHQEYEYSQELNFRLDVLEFLVLLGGLSPAVSPHFADGMFEKLRTRAQDDIKARRKWRQKYIRRLEKRPATPSTADVDRDVERLIYNSWTGQCGSLPRHDSQIDEALILHSLLSRFMIISAKVSDLIDQKTDQRWKHIAGELMLQASLESLRLQTQGYQAEYLPSLEDCFTWGFVDSGGSHDTATTASDEELTELVDKMLRLPSTSERDRGSEDPHWTKLRISTLHEFAIGTGASVESQTFRLQRLGEKYPRGAFVQRLLGVMQNMWDLSCSYLGKPMLVEIGEGHLQSIDIVGADFEDFASKLCLTKSFDSLDDIPTKVRLFETKGLLQEQSLVERYEHERQSRAQAHVHANGTSLVINLED